MVMRALREDLEGGTPHGRSSVGLRLTHPRDFAKSKNRRRFDVTRNSRHARSDAKVSRNDIEVRANDIERSHSVDFRSHSVDFRPVVSADAKSRASTQTMIG